jgi:DNA-binding NtrC family response regulator
MHKKLIKKIFIVDDDKFSSTAMEDYLTRTIPHEISLFGTGEECLRHLPEGPDIVILDYNLNSVFKDAANGMQILEAIKKTDSTIRVIMLSGQEAYGTALKTITKGAEEYVLKGEDAFAQIDALCNVD